MMLADVQQANSAAAEVPALRRRKSAPRNPAIAAHKALRDALGAR
jgi:hypothetical protein